jgi:hypothetical protein
MSLDFLDSMDLSRWKEMAMDHRKIAAAYPCYDRRMISVEDYWFKLGPWRIGFCLEIWSLPMWVGSASIQEQIGYETIELEGKGKIEVPQDALLSISSWTPEHFEQARFILGETFGPILRPGDDHQQALEYRGLFTLQHRVKYEGDMPWKRHQH